jgi:3-oxocholest-4-en-26-oate---CoA ligase
MGGDFPLTERAERLAQNSNTFYFRPMALNFADLFEHAVDAFGERTAVACGDRQVTYRELEERANRLAHHLAGLGVGPGDHVGLYARNSVEAIETLIASCKLRAAAVNINYRYVENELQYMFADSDLTALVYDRRLAPVVAAAASAAPGLVGYVQIDDGSPPEHPTAQGTAKTALPVTGYDAALAAASLERDFPARSGDDVYIIYTGGTTGYPKGVMWRHEDIWRTLAGGIDFVTGEPAPDEWAQSRKGLEGGEFVKLCAAPLIHGNAQVAALAGLFSGETIVLLPAFDAREIWRAVERHQVNVLVIIGDAMARPLVEAYLAGAYDVCSLVAVSSSAALFSPVVKDACAKALPDVVITEAIGSTETGFAGISFVSAGEPHRGGPTVMAGPDVVVLDDDNQPAAPGQVGRLARGGHVPLGYYKDPERTSAMFAEVNGKRYAVPGDLARVEDDGTVTLLGRGNTCVNTGGEKVFPEEVEGALKSHPDVFDALVIGLPDELLGQRVAALVQPRPDAAPELAALQEHVRGQIAGYKVPRSIWLTEAITRTVSGKADYGWARQYAADHPPGLDRPAGHPASAPQ